MRRRSNLGGLGVLLLICGCSGDSFTTGVTPNPEAGTSGSGHGGATGNGGSAMAGSTNGGESNSGGVQGSSGGAQGGGGAVSVEAGVSTGGAGVGIEAGVAEASGPTTWCAQKKNVLFCEDFDEFTDVDTFLGSWTTYTISGGDFAFDNGSGLPSPPNAFRIKTTAPTNVKTLIAKTLPPFTTLPNRLRMEFSLRINKAANIDSLMGIAFAGFFNGPEITDGAVAMVISQPATGTEPKLEIGYINATRDGGGGDLPGAQESVNPFPPVNRWIGRYTLDIQYSAGSAGRTGCAHLLAGGIDQLGNCQALPASLSSPKNVTVVLGAYSVGLQIFGPRNSGDVEVEFDNLVVTAE